MLLGVARVLMCFGTVLLSRQMITLTVMFGRATM